MLKLGETILNKILVRVHNNQLSLSAPSSGFVGYKVGDPVKNDGIFVEWEVVNDVFIIRNDKLGFYPCYYVQQGSELIVSSSIIDLISSAVTCETDDQAIAAFLRTGFFLGDKTAFRGIRALPPGATLRFGAKEFMIGSDPLPVGRGEALSFDTAKRRYAEMFQANIDHYRELGDRKIALPLSGGRDSRHILFALLHSGIKPSQCLTMRSQAPKGDEDARIAALVTAAAKVPHTILNQPLSVLRLELEKNVATNFAALEHSWILPLSHHLGERRVGATFDGIGGDVLCTSVFNSTRRTNLYRESKFEDLASELLGVDDYLQKMLADAAYATFSRELAMEALVEELQRHRSAPNPVGQFFFWNKTRRQVSVSTWKLLGGEGCYAFAPFLHHALIDLVTALPPEYFLERAFHDDVIASAYPEFTHVPFEAKGLVRKANPVFVNWFQLSEYLRYFGSHLTKESTCRPAFVYPRLAKAAISPNYYYESSGVLKRLLYLTQLETLSNLARGGEAGHNVVPCYGV